MEFKEHQAFQKKLKSFLYKGGFKWNYINLSCCSDKDCYSIGFEEVK